MNSKVIRPQTGRWLTATLTLLLAALSPAVAQTVGGTIEGRILNKRNGEYLENARVTVDGTGLQAFTDSTGQFRLISVPSGSATVRVFFTGLDVQSATVEVRPGARVQRDFELEATMRPAADKDAVIKLSEFRVGASREMDGASIAINEQRFAQNIRNVVAADEFGDQSDANVGEFIKFLPGVAVNFPGGEARTFTLNGAPSNNTPVTLAGFNLASAASSSTSRRFEMDQFSLNNIARIEIMHSPTPESPGSALAGSINMVPRSAFERSRPVFNGSVYMIMRDNLRHFHKTPSSLPDQDLNRKVNPGFDFSYVAPVTRNFGFTLSGGNSTQYTPIDSMENTWRGSRSATSALRPNGDPGAFPPTTPDSPYLTAYRLRYSGKESRRSSAGATIDYRFSPYDRVSLSFQYAYSDKPLVYHDITFQINSVLPGDFTPFSTKSAPAGAELRLASEAILKNGTTYMPSLLWRHDGPVWKGEAGLAVAHGTNFYSDNDKGYFGVATARRTGVNIAFDDIFYLRPRKITVTDPVTGAPIDPYRINNYALTTATGNMKKTLDLQRSAYANLRRDFVVRGIPLTLKGGLDVRESTRDLRGSAPSYTFLGADGRTTTTPLDPLGSDDGAGIVLDEVYSRREGPYGFPPVQWVHNQEYWNLYKSRPDLFRVDENARYRSEISQSKRAEETVSSAYLRGDVAFFERRLRFVGGVRAEQTNVQAEGPLTDATRNFQRDAGGRVIDSNPNQPGVQPTLIIPTSNALGVSRLTYIDRGMHAEKEYLRLFPSINASYNLRENVVTRFAYYTTVGRPDFDQYAGGLTLPDTENAPSPNNRISVNNAAIKAWTARSVNVRMEYYFAAVGQVSVGAFRRDFKNFFGNTVFNATPEFLALYGLDPEIYDPFDVATQHNLQSTVRMTGLQFDYKQALTFLPRWGRGVQVFANATALRPTGAATANFNGYVPRVYSWGVSLTREKYNLRANWNYRGRTRTGQVTGLSIEPGTFHWDSKQMIVDLQGEYYFWKKVAVYAAVRNLTGLGAQGNTFGPSTPKHARFRSQQDVGAMWTLGLKGTF